MTSSPFVGLYKLLLSGNIPSEVTVSLCSVAPKNFTIRKERVKKERIFAFGSFSDGVMRVEPEWKFTHYPFAYPSSPYMLPFTAPPKKLINLKRLTSFGEIEPHILLSQTASLTYGGGRLWIGEVQFPLGDKGMDAMLKSVVFSLDTKPQSPLLFLVGIDPIDLSYETSITVSESNVSLA